MVAANVAVKGLETKVNEVLAETSANLFSRANHDLNFTGGTT